VAPGARRLRLAPAAGRVPALHHRVEPAPPLARAGGARPRPGDPRRLPPPRPQAAADGGDHRHPSVKTGPQRGPRGYDAGKKVEGRKRVLLVDTEGDPLGLRVVPADVHEHRALRAPAPDLAAHPTLRLAWLDRGFAGEEPEAFLNRHGIAVEVVGIKDRRGFQLEKRRWKAEQTFGCLLRYRRLRVDDEMSCETSRGMAMLAALFMTGMRLERLVAS
jgi:transposase